MICRDEHKTMVYVSLMHDHAVIIFQSYIGSYHYSRDTNVQTDIKMEKT